MSNPEQVMAGRICAAVDADEKSEGCDLSAGMFGLQMSNFIREMVAMEAEVESLKESLQIKTSFYDQECEAHKATTRKLAECHRALIGLRCAPPEDGKMPPPDRQAMWQYIDNALQGVVEPLLRGDICNVLARALIPNGGDAAVAEVGDMKYHRVHFFRPTGCTATPYLPPGTKLYTRPEARVPFAYTYIHDFEHGNGVQRNARGFEEARFWNAEDVPKTYRNIQELYL